MSIDTKLLKRLGLAVPEVLLPAPWISPEAWAVIACDQHSSEPDYWDRVSRCRKNMPSTFDLILPEVYLNDEPQKRIDGIRKNMGHYMSEGYLQNKGQGWIYTQREIQGSGLRQGIVLAIDLEKYDFSSDSTSLIRASEGTIHDRLPPRVKIREGATLELPHIMMLINDPGKNLIEGLEFKTSTMQKVYDFELMLGAGKLKGYWMDDPESINALAQGFEKLLVAGQEKDDLLFVVGDGNHSLAAAKLLWEKIRDTELKNDPFKQEHHPARFALLELVNIHSPGLYFEAIHRCFFGAPPDVFFSFLEEENVSLKPLRSSFREALAWHHEGVLFYADNQWHLLEQVIGELAPSYVDNLFLRFKQKYHDASIDFIHGWDNTKNIVDKENNAIGVFLNSIRRDEIFSFVKNHGALPRKSFSMGASEDKRYYFEARNIQANN